MYIWTDTIPAQIINLNNCIAIEADEANNELYAIGNNGERYFLYRFDQENEDSRQVINAIRAIYDYLHEECPAIDMSDIAQEIRPDPPSLPDRPGRRPVKQLIVKRLDGTTIGSGSQRQIFIEAIETAGIEQVHARRLGSDRNPLVKRKNTNDPPGPNRIEDASGFYSIYGAYSANRKAILLRTISAELNLHWTVEVRERNSTEYEYQSQPMFLEEEESSAE